MRFVFISTMTAITVSEDFPFTVQRARSCPVLVPSWGQEADPKKNVYHAVLEKKSLPSLLSKCNTEFKFCNLEKPRWGIYKGAKGDVPRAIDLKEEGDSLRSCDPEFPRNVVVLEEDVTAINFLGYIKKDIPGVYSVYSEEDPEYIPPTTLPALHFIPPERITIKGLVHTSLYSHQKTGLKKYLIIIMS